MDNEKRIKLYSTEIKELGDGELEGIVATNDIDRDGEILDINGLDTTNYEKNPVIQPFHRYDMPPIGKATELRKEGGKLIAKMKFAVNENPLAKTIYELYKGGYMNAFSIGFIPKSIEPVGDNLKFVQSEMLEFSAVPVPANANALVTAKEAGIDIAVIKSLVEEQFELKEGRALSTKNFEKLTSAYKAIGEVLESAEKQNSIQEGNLTVEKSESRPAKVKRVVKKLVVRSKK